MQNTIKKCLSVLLACLMIMSVATVAFAGGGTLTVGTATGKAGEDVDIPVTLNADGVTSGVFKIRYDANVLTYKSAATATFDASSTVDGATAGTVKFAFANESSAVAANTALITVTFTIKAGTAADTYSNAVSAELEAEDADHHLKADGFFDANGEKVAVSITAGSVMVEESTTSYTVTYNANGGTTNATIATVASGSTADLTPTASKAGSRFIGWNTDSTAKVALESYTVSGDVILYAIYGIYGDVNGNGRLQGNDLTMLKNYFAAVDKAAFRAATPAFNDLNADVNGNGRLQGNDLTMLKNYFAAINKDDVPLGPKS